MGMGLGLGMGVGMGVGIRIGFGEFDGNATAFKATHTPRVPRPRCLFSDAKCCLLWTLMKNAWLKN